MADVSTPNAAYAAAAPTWRQIRDACAGEATIKAAGDMYLPRPNPGDKSQLAKERFEQYVKRAVWYGASGRTVEGLIGLGFQKDPKIELPTTLKDVLPNIDGAGLTVVQHMQATLAETLESGRAGLLTDFPKTDGKVSLADERTLGLRPTITFYDALSVINWRTVQVGAETRLSLVVLQETHSEFDDFGETIEPQFRVLRLAGGVYTVEIWREDKDHSTSQKRVWKIVDEVTPVDGNSNPLSEIPFTFVGARNNSVRIDKAPMQDIASLNVAHYRNSADFEDSVWFCGQPQVWMSGLDETWRDHLETTGIYIGSRNPLLLPTGGQAGMMQAQPNTLAKEAMAMKEAQMAALGARLIQADKTIKTATQQQSEDAVANSVLGLCADNTSAAYVRALTWASQFSKAAGKIEVEIPKDFTQFSIAPDELNSLIQSVQGGLVPITDFWRRMRAVGVIDPKKTDDNIREEIDQTPTSGLDGAGDPEDNKPPAE